MEEPTAMTPEGETSSQHDSALKSGGDNVLEQDVAEETQQGVKERATEDRPQPAQGAVATDGSTDSDNHLPTMDITFSGSQPSASGVCGVCKDQADSMSLRCSECKKKIHSGCSQLPPYQIANLLGSRRLYTCEACTMPKQDIAMNRTWESELISAAATRVSVDTREKETNTDGNVQLSISSPPMVTTERIDRLESTLSDLVRGLCEDMESRRVAQLESDLKSAKTEIHLLNSKLDTMKKRSRELEEEVRAHKSHVCKTECKCAGKVQEAMAKQLEMEEDRQKDREKIQQLEKSITQFWDQIATVMAIT